MTYSVYMVRCADATLYTGIARDVDRRLAEHNGLTPGGKPSAARTGAAYTAARRPVELVYVVQASTRSDAQKEEARLKRLTRAEKLKLIGEAQQP